MKRVVGSGFGACIEAGLAIIPDLILDRVPVDFLCGVDANFVGLHRYTTGTFGRSYSETAHTVYDFHQIRPRCERNTTIVLPRVTRPEVVVHEFGHALDHSLGFSTAATPCTWYAATNRYEGFAEAFTAWLIPGYATAPADAQTLDLFERLAADHS